MTPLLSRAGSPAARLLACLTLVAAVAAAPLALESLALGACVGLAALFAARPGIGRLLKPFGAALVAVVALLVPLLLVGQSVQAGWLGARALVAISVVLAFASTLGVYELAGALSALGVPAGLSSVVATMLRQLSRVRAQGSTLLLARRLRGAGGLAASGELIAALFERTAERAERAELAARLRGHELSTARHRARLRLRDLPLLAVAAGLAVAIYAVPALG